MTNISMLIRAPRLSDDVAEGLISAIQRREFASGERLPAERELAQRFGVSRVVIREAMARLKSEGLIQTRQGAGAFVSIDDGRVPFRLGTSAATDLQALFELRVAVESAASAMAAVRATIEDRHLIGAALRSMRLEIEKGHDAVEADEAFHAAIAQGSHNQYISRFITFLGVQIKGAIATARSNTSQRLPHAVMAVQAEHERICEAIDAGNPLEAEAAMKQHLFNAMGRLNLSSAGSSYSGGHPP